MQCKPAFTACRAAQRDSPGSRANDAREACVVLVQKARGTTETRKSQRGRVRVAFSVFFAPLWLKSVVRQFGSHIAPEIDLNRPKV